MTLKKKERRVGGWSKTTNKQHIQWFSRGGEWVEEDEMGDSSAYGEDGVSVNRKVSQGEIKL